MLYSIGEFAKLCGVHATTLRAWQRRYGLLKPQRSEGGHRLYSEDDVQIALRIVDWIKKGVPVSKVKALLERPEQSYNNNWLMLQETFLQRLHEGKIEALRQLIYESGREYPKDELVCQLLRPLRQKIAANIATTTTLREVLDGVIISYTAFCLESDKRAPGENYLICGWHMDDASEIWLEALKHTEHGKRIDILPHLSTMLAPDMFPDRHWILVTTEQLTPARQNQIEQWRNQVKSLNVIHL